MWASWTVKKAECRRLDVFELRCWRRLLRVPWTARTSNQSILKEICPGCSSEGLMLKLKLQSFGHLIRTADSLEKTLMLGKIEGRREGDERWWDGWMASPAQWTWVWVKSGSWWWTGRTGVPRSMGSQRVGHDWATELNWSEQRCQCHCYKCLMYKYIYIYKIHSKGFSPVYKTAIENSSTCLIRYRRDSKSRAFFLIYIF